MAIQHNNRISSPCRSACVSKDGCPPDRCPDFLIRRHDTRPPFKVSLDDCDGPLDLQGLVIEVNMWALAKLKCKIVETDEYFPLADNIGFEQIMVGDIIVMDRARMPEHMLVTGFDEKNKLVRVQRGYRSTTPCEWAKGQSMKIFRVLNGAAQAELVYEDLTNVDGTVDEDELTQAFVSYEWQPEDTCLPGCYWLEFKILKMIDAAFFLPGGIWVGNLHEHTDGFFYTGTEHTDSSVRLSYHSATQSYRLPESTTWTGATHLQEEKTFTGTVHNDGSVVLTQTGVSTDGEISYDEDGVAALLNPSVTPSFTDQELTPYYFNCILGEGVEWVRRFPTSGEGFLIKIENSPTSEM